MIRINALVCNKLPVIKISLFFQPYNHPDTPAPMNLPNTEIIRRKKAVANVDVSLISHSLFIPVVKK